MESNRYVIVVDWFCRQIALTSNWKNNKLLGRGVCVLHIPLIKLNWTTVTEEEECDYSK